MILTSVLMWEYFHHNETGGGGGAATSAPAPPDIVQSPVTERAKLRPPNGSPSEIPAGLRITVRLEETLSSDASHPDQEFTATVAEPIVVDGKIVIQKGTLVRGKVVAAQSTIHFKGEALLRLRLESIEIEGKEYVVHTSAVTRSNIGKDKRSEKAIGGGGLGGMVGAVVGGGKGTAIGAAAGARTAAKEASGSGNKKVVLRPESTVTFRLIRPVELKETTRSIP